MDKKIAMFSLGLLCYPIGMYFFWKGIFYNAPFLIISSCFVSFYGACLIYKGIKDE